MYKEPIEIVRESLAGIVNSDYPKDKLIVVLTLEERAGKHSQEIAEICQKEKYNALANQ
jgi:cellulose synthase/poly-beta-1,6-N-acetylglucosamine synthase-like glycosyltransferase